MPRKSIRFFLIVASIALASNTGLTNPRRVLLPPTLNKKAGIVAAGSAACDVPRWDCSEISVTSQAGSTARSAAARAADVLNPRDFGAIGDGKRHTVISTLGIDTLNALATYRAPNGVTPYSWVSSYPFGTLFNLPVSVAVGAGTTALRFQKTALVGVTIPTYDPTTLGATSLPVSPYGGLVVGTVVSGANIAPGTTVTALSGTHVTLSIGTTGALARGGPITFAASPPSPHAVYLQDVTGLYQGMRASGACVAANSQIDQVNAATGEIRLSAPMTCLPAGGAPLVFTQSWLSDVVAGMQVSGPAGVFPAGETVASVDRATGVVMVAAPLNGPLRPREPNHSLSAQNDGSPVTFFAPYTDAQAAALQMDRIGIQAAVKAGEVVGAGNVVLAGGVYLIDGPIIFPVTQQFSAEKSVSLQGAGQFQTELLAISDAGPGNAVLSCGDPSGEPLNGRGRYTGSGAYCWGQWRDLHIAFNGNPSAPGYRPKDYAGVPVNMDGVHQGPRREMSNVNIERFRSGIDFMGDHTKWDHVEVRYSFNGFRLNAPSGTPGDGLFGDFEMIEASFDGNGWAGVSIHPLNDFSGHLLKPYIAGNPYGFYLEPGSPGNGPAIGVSHFEEGNYEYTGCSLVQDGNIAPNFLATGARRGLMDVSMDVVFGNMMTSGALPGGCRSIAPGVTSTAPPAYIDVDTLSGLEISHIVQSAFPPIAGAQTFIRTNWTRNFSTFSGGGVLLSGPGLYGVLQSYAGACQEIVAGAGDAVSTFHRSGSVKNVKFDIPGVGSGRLFTFSDTGKETLRRGTLLGYVAVGDIMGVEREGRSSRAPFAGVVPFTYPCAMSGRSIAALTQSSEAPLLTPFALNAGTLVYPATPANPGVASVSGSTPIGIVSAPPASHTLGYMQTLPIQ